MKLSKKQREELFNKYGGKCAYCGCELPKRWHADHIEPIVRTWDYEKYTTTNSKGREVFQWKQVFDGKFVNPENDKIENMNPACPECNMKKGCFTIEQFREDLSCQVERAIRDSKNFRFALKYGQVQLTSSPIVFYFEKYCTA